VTGGARYENHDSFGSSLTWRVTGAVELPVTRTLLRGSLGTGFKAPTLAQLFDDSFGSANPGLDPETSFGLDAGIDQRLFDDRLRLAASYFYNSIDDMIVAIFVPPFAFVNENVENVRTQGVEATLQVELPLSVSLISNYTYTHTRALDAASFGVSADGQLLRRPEHEANLDLSWSPLGGRANLTFGLLYVGERLDLDPVTFETVGAGAYVVLHLAGRYALTRWLEIHGRVRNLADADYEDILGFETEGISAFGGFTLSF